MDYYRLLVKKQDGKVAVSDITKHTIDNETFEQMSWDKPIIRHFDGGMFHFIALSKEYLEVLKEGMFLYGEMTRG